MKPNPVTGSYTVHVPKDARTGTFRRPQGNTVHHDHNDPVHHPSHYNSHPSGIETIRITEHETFLRGNILKYVLRAPYKGNELQDLEKAQWYLSREIDRVKGEHS